MANYVWSDLDIITVPPVRAVNNIPKLTHNISVSNKFTKPLMSSRNHNLRHILHNEYNWKYKLSFWK